MSRELPSEDTTRVSAVACLLIHDKVVTSSQSSSGKYAKINAAAKALTEMDGMAAYEFRQEFG